MKGSQVVDLPGKLSACCSCEATEATVQLEARPQQTNI